MFRYVIISREAARELLVPFVRRKNGSFNSGKAFKNNPSLPPEAINNSFTSQSYSVIGTREIDV